MSDNAELLAYVDELIQRCGVDRDLLVSDGYAHSFFESAVSLMAEEASKRQAFRNESQPRTQLFEQALASARKADKPKLEEELAEVRHLAETLAEVGYVFDAVKRDK